MQQQPIFSSWDVTFYTLCTSSLILIVQYYWFTEALRSFVLHSFVPAPFCHALFWRRAYLGTLLSHALLAVNHISHIFRSILFKMLVVVKSALSGTIFSWLFQTKRKKSKGLLLRLMSLNTTCFTLQFKILTNENYQPHLVIIGIIKRC